MPVYVCEKRTTAFASQTWKDPSTRWIPSRESLATSHASVAISQWLTRAQKANTAPRLAQARECVPATNIRHPSTRSPGLAPHRSDSTFGIPARHEVTGGGRAVAGGTPMTSSVISGQGVCTRQCVRQGWPTLALSSQGACNAEHSTTRAGCAALLPCCRLPAPGGT